MNNNTDVHEIKRMNKIRIAKFIQERGTTSKAEIASNLSLSMPTTLANVKELMEEGIVEENGAYQSTGGRKAKALSIVGDMAYVVGVDITNNHVTFVLVNAKKEILKSERIRLAFQESYEYYETIGDKVTAFIKEAEILPQKVIKAGISVPGIVDKEQKIMLQSHTLRVNNVSLKYLEQSIGYPCSVENDANSAAFAEIMVSDKDSIYLSLSNTVGGAIYLHDKLYIGDNYKSAEFGHMIIEKDGKVCYCGKNGCVDAYCSARVLQDITEGNLELFFNRLQLRVKQCETVWQTYLDYLAITITNLRMAFDCDVILGGYVGGYMREHMKELNKKLAKYNNFDIDTTYVRCGKYKYEAAAYGVTIHIIDALFQS